MAGELTARTVEGRAKRKGRYLDGNGLFLRVLDPGKRVYWVYRFRVGKRDREMSLGKYPAMTLADARARHAELRAAVMKGLDPMGERRGVKTRPHPPPGRPSALRLKIISNARSDGAS